MEVQHLNVKIFAADSPGMDLGLAIPVFHRWIQSSALPELLIDVADYRHVPDGPGVLLVAHEAVYSLDSTGGQLGLLYNRRAADEGSFEEKLERCYSAALAAARLLERESEFAGRLRFETGLCEVIFNDRLLVPNDSATAELLRPQVEVFFARRWNDPQARATQAGEPRERLRFVVRAPSFQ